MKPCIAIHGGAWNIPNSLWPAHQQGIANAHKLGMEVLERGGSAIEAIAAAIRTMEDDPIFDAGIGSFLNEDGCIEMDAGLMEGSGLTSGAVLGVAGIANPIDLAMHVLQFSDHCLFTGEGALRLAKKAGFATVDPSFHILEREAHISQAIQSGDTSYLDEAWVAPGHDTVGAIALDSKGTLAAGNSTGGIRHKALGRVGDAALIGSGFYADNQLGAVICTGWGESIMRSGMAMKALHSLANYSCQEAADHAIAHLANRVNGYGGVVVMKPDGTAAASYNTQRMAVLLPEKA